MNGYLLDTSFLSAFAPDRPPLPPCVQSWIAEQRKHGLWYISSIVVLEVERGLAKLRRTGGLAKAGRIGSWFDALLAEFDQRVLPVDRLIAKEAGRLEDVAIALGRSPGLADALIAATARMHDLSVLTANSRHFQILGVPHLNPLAENGL